MMRLRCLSDHRGSLLRRSACNLTGTSCLAPVQTFRHFCFSSKLANFSEPTYTNLYGSQMRVEINVQSGLTSQNRPVTTATVRWNECTGVNVTTPPPVLHSLSRSLRVIARNWQSTETTLPLRVRPLSFFDSVVDCSGCVTDKACV